jgi:hypothetical protein
MYLTTLTEIPTSVPSLAALANITTLTLVGEEPDLIVPGIASIQVFLNATTPVGTAMYPINNNTTMLTR